MSNLEIWNKFNQPPKSALKQIGGGRLKGMTDINPQWRYKAMTEAFGACGIGWKYEILNTWSEQAADGIILAFAKVALFIKNGEWSEPIHGIGGSTMVAKETSGLYSSDECYKMAVTDALSVAMKMLGVASDIYEGLWDGSKYRDAPEQSPKESTQKSNSEQEKKDDKISTKQWEYMKKIGEKIGLTEMDVVQFIKWVAEQNNIEPRHWKMSKLILPENNFNTEYAKYTQREIEDDLPFPDESPPY